METKVSRFLRYLEVEKGLCPSTIQAYKLDLERGLIPFLCRRGKFRAEEVTIDDIRAYLDFLAHEKCNSVAARARKLAAIKSFFNYLVENEGLHANPAASIKTPKIPEKEPAYLTDDECIRLLETVASKARPEVRERDIAIILLFLHLGIRASELVRIKLTDVDLKVGQIKLRRKGNKEQYLHVNGETRKAMRTYLARRPQAQNGTFFVGIKGGSLERTFIYNMVRRYLQMAGINKGKHGPHLLRHTFCMRLHQKGVNPFVIKELAGHRSLDTTMRYIRIEDKERVQALNSLEFGIANL